jgi:hypothetical protein
MNHSIITADRNTHLKILVVALIAAITLVTVGIAARLTSGVELAGMNAPLKVGVVKAEKPVVWSSRADSTIR